MTRICPPTSEETSDEDLLVEFIELILEELSVTETKINTFCKKACHF
jgi:hypothetical protein